MNTEKMLADYGQELKKLTEQAIPLFSKYGKADENHEIAEMLAAKLQDFKPSIMFYGIYNAGKSSIINAFMGEQKAKVADVPTTYAVDRYDWHGYALYDTPGIDAPVAHELVSKEHLRKCDVIIFVMSTNGTFEAGKNYEELLEIMLSGKQLIIVLNDKSGFNPNDPNDFERLRQIKLKVLENIRMIAQQRKVDIAVEDKYQVLVVNAARALKGIQENKPGIVKASGIPEMEREILRELKRVDGFKVLKAATEFFDEHLAGLEQQLGQKQDSEAIKKLVDLIKQIRQQKALIKNNMRTNNRTLINAVETEIYNAVLAAQGNEAQATSAIEQIITKFNGKIETELTQQLKEALEIIDTEFNNAKFSIVLRDEKLAARLSNIQAGLPVEPLGEAAATLPSAQSQNQGPGVGDLMANGTAAKEVGKQVAGFIGKEVVGVLTSAGFKQAAALVAKFVPYIGPIIIVGTILYSLFGGKSDSDYAKKLEEVRMQNEQARRQTEQMIQARQELKQRCSAIAYDLMEVLNKSIDDAINELFGAREDNLSAALAEQNSQAADLAQDMKSLATIRQSVRTIAFKVS